MYCHCERVRGGKACTSVYVSIDRQVSASSRRSLRDRSIRGSGDSVFARPLEIRRRIASDSHRAIQSKRIQSRRSCKAHGSKTVDNERYRATRSVNIYARINAILRPSRVSILPLHLAVLDLGGARYDTSSTCVRQEKTTKHLARTTAGGTEGVERRRREGGKRMGTMRWMRSARDASTTRHPSSRTDSTAIRGTRGIGCSCYSVRTLSVSRNGNVGRRKGRRTIILAFR